MVRHLKRSHPHAHVEATSLSLLTFGETDDGFRDDDNDDAFDWPIDSDALEIKMDSESVDVKGNFRSLVWNYFEPQV